MANSKPDLLFGPGESTGFTPAGVAAFDDLRPAAVVRELIQNALDAARACNRKPAIVRFRLSSIRRAEIPGMNSYEDAFERARRHQSHFGNGELPRQAELVCNRIQAALDENRLDVLSVLDNGIGLDSQRMSGLLSDGLSIKGAGATGTYGNGHATAIPASDLRYVLYGGVTPDGRLIASGHAVLASYFVYGEQHIRGGGGFYIRDFKPGAKTLFRFATGTSIPRLIRAEIDRIREDFEHGTAVVIPAFNHFLEGDSQLRDRVFHAASASFFVAIHQGELTVEVEDARSAKETKHWSLDRSTLGEVLDKHRDEKRSKGFLSGAKAFDAHRTFHRGKGSQVTTSAGAIGVHLAESASGTTRIELCRNGMWITDRLPGFHGKFADRVPFHAVLSLNADGGDKLHDLVRTAEGPLHDKLEAKRLERDEKRSFRKSMAEIIAWLKRNTTEMKSDAFNSDEFLTLDLNGGGIGGSRRNKAFRGAPVVMRRRPTHQIHSGAVVPDGNGERVNGDGNGETSSSMKGKRSRPVLNALFQAVSRPAGDRRRCIRIKFHKGCENAQMRLLVDEGLDATCERHGLDKYAPAELANVTVDGEQVGHAELEYWEKRAVGIRLGDVTEGRTVTVETDFDYGSDFGALAEPSLRIDVFATRKQQSDSPANRSRDDEATNDE